VTSITADQFEKDFNATTKPVFDVRRNSEYEAEQLNLRH